MSRPAVARSASRRPRGARRPLHDVVAVQLGRHVPGLHDPRRDPRAARAARPRRALGAAPDEPQLRRRGARGDGDDREAGWLRRAGEHHPRRSCRRRHVGDHRPQVVLLLPPVRRLPHPRPDRVRPLLLPLRGQRPRLPDPAPQGQAGHPLAALVRGRVPRRARRTSSARRAAACRRSSAWSTTRGSTA